MQLESGGIDAEPPQGTTSWPSGTVIPVNFAPQNGYDNPVVFLDDTLRANIGTVIMSAAHTMRSATDTNFAARPGIAQLRLRLRSLVNASNKPLAFARYLTWALDTAADPAIDEQIALAEYLEFDPVADSSALATLDDALANYGFQVNHAPAGRHIVTILSPQDNVDPVIADRIRQRARRQSAATFAPDTGVAFIFVNGIRTIERGALAASSELATMLGDTAQFPHAVVTYYWNRNLRGEIIGFTDPILGCAGRAGRDAGFRAALVALARWGACKTISIVTIPLLDDVGNSVLGFVNQQWHVETPQSADAGRLARRVSVYHSQLQHTILVTHSAGNMLFAQAALQVPDNDGVPLQTNGCTAAMSLAAPIDKENFNVDSTHLRGMTIRGDILLELTLPNNLEPLPDHYTSQATLDKDAEVATSADLKRPYLNMKWGVRIHDVIPNYFDGVLRDTTVQFLHQLYNTCMSAP